MIVTAVLHTLGNSTSLHGRDEALAINEQLRVVYWAFVYTISVTFVALGVINLLIAAKGDDRLVRFTGWANFVWVGAFGLVCLHYWIPPPLIFAAVIEAFVLAAIVF